VAYVGCLAGCLTSLAEQYFFMNFFHRDEAFVEIEQLTNEAISRLLSATPTDGVLPGAATGGTASGICTLRATA